MNTDKIYAEAVANEYAQKSTTKVVALHKLDKKVKMPAYVIAYTAGVVFTLLLGLAMCLVMGKIGGGTTTMLVVGSILGALGIAGMGVNYPVYKKILARGKEKYASDILQLAKEISDAELS